MAYTGPAQAEEELTKAFAPSGNLTRQQRSAIDAAAALVPKNPTAYLSSEDGMSKVQDAGARISSLQPPPPPTDGKTTTTTTTTDETKTPSGGLTLEDVLAVTKDLTGWNLNKDGTYTPSADALKNLGVTKEDTQLDEAEKATQEAKAERDALFLQLKNFDVSNDPMLQNQVSGITAAWDRRIAEMDRINRSRVAAIRTTGVRLGSRWTGGDGGVMGSIVTAEEREGVERISKLESDKRQAILEAQNAHENRQWTKYYQRAQLADKLYQEQLGVLKELNKVQAEQDKKLREQNQEIAMNDNIYNSVVGLGGKADPLSIYQDLRKKGVSVTMEDIDKFWDAAKTKQSSNGLYKFSNSAIGKMLARGYGSDQIQAIQDDLNDGGPNSVLQGLPASERSFITNLLSSSSSGGTGTGGVLTWSELSARGLPPELFGKNEEMVMRDIVSSQEPPQWFMQYLSGSGAEGFNSKYKDFASTVSKFSQDQQGMLLERGVQSAAKKEWDIFRGNITKNLVDATYGKEGTKKAKLKAVVSSMRDDGQPEDMIRAIIVDDGYDPDDPYFED